MSTSTTEATSVDLDVTGMTCASCAARIEKKLGKLDGVSASVNYATNRAHVLAPATVTVDDLIKTVQAAGYDAREARPGDEVPDESLRLRTRLIVAAVFAVPVIAMAMAPVLQFPGWQWVSLALATPVVWWAGWPFHKSAWVNARHGAATMDTLISIGTTAAYLWSLYALLFGHAGMIGLKHQFELSLTRHDATANIYFEAAVGIITFLLLGRYFEARSRREAASAVREMLSLGARQATLLVDGQETLVPIERVAVGDEFVVRPGEKIATDGQVVDGRSAIDASLVTGESVPVEVSPGSAVTGATLNTSGRLIVRATRVGAETQLAQMARLVEEAQTGKAPVQRLADRIAGVFVPIVMGLALITLVGWLIAGEPLNFALTSAIAVLIIACPCALGLATPTALLVGTGRGAQLGIVIRGPEILESTRTVDTVVLDKTGTITTGAMQVAARAAAEGEDETYVTDILAAAESGSEHPVAKALAGDGSSLRATAVTAVPGRGITAEVDGLDVVAGSPAMLAERGITVPGGLATFVREQGELGRSLVLVAWSGQARGAAAISDEPKPTAAPAIAALQRLGLTPVLLSGDTQQAAERVAHAVGITSVQAEVSPADKVGAIKTLQADGRTVAMVGDGVNDAAALAQADLGIAMGSGTDAAITASDLTLMNSDPMAVADAIRLSRATLRTIKVNLFWAFAYNVAAIPVAALGLLNPMIAGAAMAFSSVFVVSNSLRLRLFRPLK